MPVIGTAGHVDHGKSALVQALTGIDPDRLREEKERGLTIDLGFAWLTLPSGLEVGIVDVPGHERFIKNMLAGAGGIDVALLVIAADEGPRQQTSEHLAILNLLEVPAGIVVITKCDLVEPDYIDLVEAEVAEMFTGSRLASAPVVRVSAVTGEGLEALLVAIDSAVAATPPRRDLGRARLPVDRVFTVKGFGTVVTGTLVDGGLEVGQEVEIIPSGKRARVRGLQRHRSKVDTLGPGNRVAVNLAGVREEELHRGVTVARPGRVKPATSIVARLAATRALAHPLAHDAEVTVMCATAETQAKLRLLDCDTLERGGEAWCQLVFASEIPAMPADHVIIRTPNETAAGGRIVAVNGRRLRRNDQETLVRLRNRLEGTPGARVVEALRAGPLKLDPLAAATGIPTDTLEPTLPNMKQPNGVFNWNGFFYSGEWVDHRAGQVQRAITAYLDEHRLRGRAPREHIRSTVHLDPATFDLLIEIMQRVNGVIVEGSDLSVHNYDVKLTPAQQAEADAFLAGLRASPYSPPTDRIPEPNLLRYLHEHGQVMVTGAGVVFTVGAFAEMAERTRAYIRAHGSISIAEFRDLFGTSRKYAQAFLEHLDALHVTRRSGDVRTLR